MSGWFDRLRTWWTKVPDLPLDVPKPDGDLAERMSHMASEFATRRRLDFEVDALSDLNVVTDGESVIAVGAFVGELIVRQSPSAAWARNGRGDPGIGAGSWLADPFEWVERTRSSAPSMPLSEYVSSVVAFAEDPSDQTSERLGLETTFQPQTAWGQFKDWARRRRRRP